MNMVQKPDLDVTSKYYPASGMQVLTEDATTEIGGGLWPAIVGAFAVGVALGTYIDQAYFKPRW